MRIVLRGTDGKPHPVNNTMYVDNNGDYIDIDIFHNRHFIIDGESYQGLGLTVSPNIAKKFAQELIRMSDKMINEQQAGTVVVHNDTL